MKLLTPLGLLGLLGLLVLLLIYLLKPNYQQKMVSSTYVWKRSLRYRKRKLPISKLRNILIIICQVLILTACAFILAQPFIKKEVPPEITEKAAVIDASAENGKEVTVLIELRARFDEQNNIDWSERLEEAGCRVIYGFEGYKVHSKICLITYRNRNNIEYITQVGTGNYNEKTATMYTDVSLITADKGIGEDAAVFFKNMSIGNLNGSYQHIIVSPTSLKPKVLSLMDEEIKKGTNGRIIMKMNSVTDVDFIQKVSEASNAGVKVDLIVRGICCILPGVKGYTENLRVTSIVGRYLEHPRIFLFGTGADQKIYIGSADMMTRNTEKRVEVACPVYDETIRKQLAHMLKIMLADNVKARELKSDGKYYMKEKGTSKVNSQEYFMREAITVRHPEGRTKQSFVDKIRKIFRRK